MNEHPGADSEDFDQSALARLVDMVACESQELLEIVNFNVEGEQYVCSGTVR